MNLLLAFATCGFLALALPTALAQSGYNDLYKVLDGLATNYNKAVRPNPFGAAVGVGVELYIMGIPSVDEKKMEFSLDMYFRQYWTDDRLKFSPAGGKILNHASLKDRVWTPDPFFVNQKEGKVLDNPADNTLFKIKNDGSITYSSRQLVTTYCPMDLVNYPFDTQKCTLEIESFAHTSDEVLYFWKGGNSSVKHSDHITNPTFTVLGYKLDETFVTLSTGKYNRLKVTFFMRRDLSKFIHRSVVPSSVVTLISSLAFWLHPSDDCGSRAIIILVSWLFLLGVYMNAVGTLVVGYMTYADYFFFCCAMFLLANLVVFIIVMLVRRSGKRHEENGRCQNACIKKFAWLDAISRLIFVPLFIAYLVMFAHRSHPIGPDQHNLVPLKH